MMQFCSRKVCDCNNDGHQVAIVHLLLLLHLWGWEGNSDTVIPIGAEEMFAFAGWLSMLQVLMQFLFVIYNIHS
jgi:hypothetical protein